MTMTSYFRPIVRTGSPRSENSILFAETNYWISEAEEILDVDDVIASIILVDDLRIQKD